MAKYTERLRYEPINIASSGDNTIITINSGEMSATWDNLGTYIVIDQINLVPAAAVTVQLKDGLSSETGHRNYGGLYSLAQNQGFVLENAMQNEDDGVIRLGPNRSFIITLGGSVQVSGFVRYRLMHTN